MALITAAEARTRIPAIKNATGEDTGIDTLIGMIGRVFARYCGYPRASDGSEPTMEDATYVEDVTGRGGRTLELPVFPVVSITSIYDDSGWTFGSDSLVDSSDYVLRKKRYAVLTETASHGAWSTADSAIRCTFVAGFETAPEDLKLACELAIRNLYDLNFTQGKSSITQNDVTTTFRADQVLIPMVVEILANYVLPRAVMGGR